MSILLLYSNKQLLVALSFSIIFLLYISLIYALIFIISFFFEFLIYLYHIYVYLNNYIISVFYFFGYILNTVCCHFFLAWRISFSISYKARLVAVNSLYLYFNIFILPSFWTVFLDMKFLIIILKIFISFNTLNILPICLLTLNVFDGKSTVNHSGVPCIESVFFSLAAFKNSLSLWLSKFDCEVTMYRFSCLWCLEFSWAS